MSEITVYCEDAKGLKLGPGEGLTPIPGELIVFTDGYATFEESDYPEWREWQFAVGTPHLEVLSEGEVAADDAAEFVCATCGKAFETKNKLNGHRMSHRPGR